MKVTMIYSIRESLIGWTDFDVVCWEIGCSFGLFERDENLDSFREHKWIFWSNNPLIAMLGDVIESLVHCGALHVHPDDELQFRFNGSYVPGATPALLDPVFSCTQRFRRVEEILAFNAPCRGGLARGQWMISGSVWGRYYVPLLTLRDRVQLQTSPLCGDDFWILRPGGDLPTTE